MYIQNFHFQRYGQLSQNFMDYILWITYYNIIKSHSEKHDCSFFLKQENHFFIFLKGRVSPHWHRHEIWWILKLHLSLYRGKMFHKTLLMWGNKGTFSNRHNRQPAFGDEMHFISNATDPFKCHNFTYRYSDYFKMAETHIYTNVQIFLPQKRNLFLPPDI